VAIVGNGRQTGGGKQVARRAFLDDGLLDILVVREIPASKLLDAVREPQALSSEGQYIFLLAGALDEFCSGAPGAGISTANPSRFATKWFRARSG